MIVLDASVLIAHVEPADVHHRRARDLLLAMGAEPLAASPITLAEFYVGPARGGSLDSAASVVADLGLGAVPLPADAPQRLAVLRCDTGLTLPDCCVLLAAQQVGGAVASFDERVQRGARALGLRCV